MKGNLMQGNFIMILLLLIICGLLGADVYFTKNPPATPVVQGLTKQQEETLKQNQVLLEKVRKLTNIPENEKAVIATVTDAEGLRKAHPIQAEIYKDAKEGDKVIGLSDKMIIFDEASNAIVYEGKSPAQVQEEKYLEELGPVMSELSKLTNIDPTARPTLATVTDPDKLREAQPELYKDALVGDKLVVFEDRIIIFRPSSNEIIFDGKIKVNQGTQQPAQPAQPANQ